MTASDSTATPVRTTSLWHPFADMHAVSGNELTIVRGDGSWLWDDSGRRYLDATASLWFTNVGHGRPELAEAAQRQFERLDAYMIFNEFSNEPAAALAERLAGYAPMRDARAFLTSGGGDAIDSASKIARRYWEVEGEPDRQHLISRRDSYHGTHGFGTSLAGIEANRSGWGRLVPDVSNVAHDSVDALAAEIERLGPERVAAFFFEPVMGAAGVLPPPPGYVEGVMEVCRDNGVLVVVDAVVCGFGRLGEWFGIERWDVEPDMIVFAKGVTSGYLPLGGVMVSGRVAEPFWDRPGNVFRHGPTYSGHPVCCAVALANLDVIEGEGLLARSRELEGELLGALEPLADRQLVRAVRGGTGLMAGVEIDPASGVTTMDVALRARELGVLVRPLLTTIALSPALTTEVEEIQLAAETLGAALDDLESGI